MTDSKSSSDWQIWWSMTSPLPRWMHLMMKSPLPAFPNDEDGMDFEYDAPRKPAHDPELDAEEPLTRRESCSR